MRSPLTGLHELVPGLNRILRTSIGFAALRTPVFAAAPLAIRRIFDDAIPHHDGEQIALFGTLLLGLYIADGVVLLTLRRKAAHFATAAVVDLRERVVERLYLLPRSWHDDQDPGLLHAVVVQDCERLLVALGQLIAWVVPTLVACLALAGVAFAIAPALACMVGGALALVFFAVVPLGRAAVRDGKSNAEALRTLSARWRLALRVLPAALAHGGEDTEAERAGVAARAVGAAALRLHGTQARMIGAVDLASAFLAAVILIVGSIGITRGWLTTGAMLSFYAVGILMLRQLSLATPGVASALSDASSINRLLALLSTPESQPYSGSRVHQPEGEIALESVCFSYQDEGRAVLDDVTLGVRAGEHVAVLGPNGAGKSTLVSLLLGLHRPTSGRVLIDGIPMEDLHITSLRRGIGYASQDPVLFAGTIAENIAYAHPKATVEEIEWAARLSTVASFLPFLPEGLDTKVGDEGALLSGGQRQRIALARAVVRRPKLLILDEPSTYLDAAAIDELLDRLDDLPEVPTIVTITHDERIARRAERIFRVRDGRMESEAIRLPS